MTTSIGSPNQSTLSNDQKVNSEDQNSSRLLFQQVADSTNPELLIKGVFERVAPEKRESFADQFIFAAGKDGLDSISATPEGQHALATVYDHATTDGRGYMREVHENQGNTAVDYTRKDVSPQKSDFNNASADQTNDTVVNQPSQQRTKEDGDLKTFEYSKLSIRFKLLGATTSRNIVKVTDTVTGEERSYLVDTFGGTHSLASMSVGYDVGRQQFDSWGQVEDALQQGNIFAKVGVPKAKKGIYRVNFNGSIAPSGEYKFTGLSLSMSAPGSLPAGIDFGAEARFVESYNPPVSMGDAGVAP
jgi:hypothetical protein